MLGGGGYVAGPVGLAALTRRIPVVLTEADSHLGLTNRLLAPRARRVCLAFPIEGRDGDRYLVTGRPVPPAVDDRAAARAEFGIPPEATVRARLRRLARRALDQPGRGRGVRRRAASTSSTCRARATSPQLDARRASTTTCASTSSRSAGRSSPPTSPSPAPAARCSSSPSTGCRPILIPYPHASADHQTANARWMAEAGAATILADAELTPAAAPRRGRRLLGDPGRLAGMAAASRRLARPDAAAVVAREVLAAAAQSH